MINTTPTEIFEARTHRRTENEVSRWITAVRFADGRVEIRVSAEDEWDDAMHLFKTLTAEEAEELGRALLCKDDTFESIAERALK